MTNYTYTFSTSGDVQTALDNGTLGKPYVAYISGTSKVDYNTMDVTPSYIAVWNDVYGDHKEYTFTVTDNSPSLWEQLIKIGTINCWYAKESEVSHGNIDIYLAHTTDWNFLLADESYDTIETLENGGDTEYISVREAELGSSDWLPLKISYDSENVVFTFFNDESLSMTLTTINPTE